jgi:hypothetical protein
MSWNNYAYVDGDPVNSNDPTGLDAIDPLQPSYFYCTVGAGEGTQQTLCELWTWTGAQGGRIGEGNSNFPQCNKTDAVGQENSLNFIMANYASAQSLSALTKVPADWILGWAAAESTATPTSEGGGYGQTAVALQNQNYFGQRGSSWIGAMSSGCPGAASGFACFLDFQASAISALMTTHYNWTFDGTNGVSAGQILTSFNGNTQAAFQALANAGQDRGNSAYGVNAAAAIQGVDLRISCLKQNGYL